MDDAMEKDFFFLNFALKLFLIQERVAGSLEKLHALLKFRFGAMESEEPRAFKLKGNRCERDFPAKRRFLNPGFRPAQAVAARMPESIGFDQKVFQKRGFLCDGNLSVTRLGDLPEFGKPRGWRGEPLESSIGAVLQEHKSEFTQELRERARHFILPSFE
jgi:hypothetical protein